jgi:hypothetical protein
VDQNELLQNEKLFIHAVLQAKNTYLLVGWLEILQISLVIRLNLFQLISKTKDEDESLKVSSQDVATKLPIDVVLSGPKAIWLIC